MTWRLVWSLLAITLTARGAIRAVIMLDASGSVKAAYDDRSMARLESAARLSLPSGTFPTLWKFNTQPNQVRDISEIKAGGDTKLDLALSTAIAQDPQLIWFITDNIQDDESGVGDTSRFYNQLRRDQVRRVEVFPLRMAGGGQAGLVVYLIQLGDLNRTVFDTVVKSFQNRANAEPLLMKPLDQEALVADIEDQSGDGTFEEGRPLTARAKIRFSSRYNHLDIREGDITTTKTSPEFDDASLLDPEQREPSISPQRLTRVRPGGSTEQIYLLSVDLGRVRLRRNLRSLWLAAFDRSSETAIITIPLSIEVKQDAFEVSKDYLSRYSSPDTKSARLFGGIFGLDKLPSTMAAPVTPIAVNVALKFRVVYPSWPAIMFVVFGIVLLSVLSLAIRFASRFTGKAHMPKITAVDSQGNPLKVVFNDDVLVVGNDRIGHVEDGRLSLLDTVSSTQREFDLRQVSEVPCRVEGRDIFLHTGAPKKAQPAITRTELRRR